MNAIVKELSRSASWLGMSAGEQRHYSILRALRAGLSGSWHDAGLEKECSDTIAEKLGRNPRGLFVPLEIQRAPPMTTVKPGEGAELMPTVHDGDNWHLKGVHEGAILPYATVLNDLVGDVSLPIFGGGGSGILPDEESERAENVAPTDQALLKPKTIGGSIGISRLLLKQSSPSVDEWLLARAQDAALFYLEGQIMTGTGAGGQILGIKNNPDVDVQTIAGPTWAELCEMEKSVVGSPGTRPQNYAYLCDAGTQETLKTTERAAGSMFLQEGGICNGHPVRTHLYLFSNEIIFGNWRDLVVGFWGTLDISVDRAKHAASGGAVIRSWLDCDAQLLNAGQFIWGAKP